MLIRHGAEFFLNSKNRKIDIHHGSSSVASLRPGLHPAETHSAAPGRSKRQGIGIKIDHFREMIEHRLLG